MTTSSRSATRSRSNRLCLRPAANCPRQMVMRRPPTEVTFCVHGVMPAPTGCPATRPRSEIEIIMCPRPSARSHGQKGAADDGCMGRSRRAHHENPCACRCRRPPIDLVHGRTGPRRQARHRHARRPPARCNPARRPRAYDRDSIRSLAAQKRAWAKIPPKKNRTGSFSHCLGTRN